MTLRLLPCLLFAAGVAHADTLYKCADESGHATYTNQKSAAGKNCVILSQDKPVSTFVAPKAKANTPTPSDFPKVNPDAQKSRDGDRKRILEEELNTERRNLDQARKSLVEQEGTILPEERMVKGGVQGGKVEERLQRYRDQVQLHERNIEALQKELGNVR